MSKVSQIRQTRSGQTIMEMLVALSALTIGLLGIVALLNSSLGLNRIVADNYRATYLAAEGIEIVKSIVITNSKATESNPLRPWCAGLPAGNYEFDYKTKAPDPSTAGSFDCATPFSGFASILGSSTTKLRFHADTHLYDYSQVGSEDTAFMRTITISYKAPEASCIPDDQMIVHSVVEWDDRTGHNQVDLVDYLFNPASSVSQC